MTTHDTSTTHGSRRTKAGLTERYVHAATRTLPEDQRDDVGDELRASIGDRVESLRESAGLSEERAEYAALEELGDPDRLAAGYTGRRLQLIGPEMYPAYLRVLKPVLYSVVPIVAIVIAVITAIEGRHIGAIIGESVWVAFTVTVQICFWVTLVFALLERGTSTDDLRSSMKVEWNPDLLPDVPRGSNHSLVEMVSGLVWIGFLAGALVWQQVSSPLGDDVPVLDPDLWSFWLPLILVLLLAEAAFEVVKYRLAGWTPTLATVNVVLGAAFAAPFVYLAASDRLLNPAAVTEIQDGWSGFDPGTVNVVVIVAALVIWVWDSVDGWVKALSTRPSARC